MSTADTPSLEQQVESIRQDFDSLRKQIGRVIVGQQETVDLVLTALVAGGHVLLEGGPGLGKTLLVRTLADAVELEFRRIQFTPDLMPADVVGTYVVMETHGRRQFEFQQGPIFANILLIDEINRAIPKTQAALLEGLSECAITVANETYELPDPFFALATQSGDETEGTFPLPEKQLDRFMFKLKLPFPSDEDIATIIERTTEAESPIAKPVLAGARIIEISQLIRQVTIADEVRDYAIRTLTATHPAHASASPLAKRFVARGASPRGAQAMVLAAKVQAVLDGRVHVAREDLRAVALPTLRHRVMLNFDGHAEGIDTDRIIEEILGSAGAQAA